MPVLYNNSQKQKLGIKDPQCTLLDHDTTSEVLSLHISVV